MKRTRIKSIGPIGKANIEARRIIAEISEEMNLIRCEIQLTGCKEGLYLAPAHRHKRIWYKGNADLLADYRQWVCACVVCHSKIENDHELTERIFLKLRGDE